MKRKYKDIDPILDVWLLKYGLTVYKYYKDYEVRSISVIDDQGSNYHMWIEIVDNKYIINAAKNDSDFKRESDIQNFSYDLDIVYSKVNDWILENGNTRENYKS